MYGDIGVSAPSLHRESTDSLIKCVLAGTLYGCENLKIVAESSIGEYSIYVPTLTGIDASKAQERWSLPLATELDRR